MVEACIGQALWRVSRELARYKLDLVWVQVVRWKGGATEPNQVEENEMGGLCSRNGGEEERV
jgi:hypothetical protein